MKFIKLPNGNKMEFYSYTMTNACLIKFLYSEKVYASVVDFFGTGIIPYMEIVDENDNIMERIDLNMTRTVISIIHDYIISIDHKLVAEAYDEEVTIPIVDDNGDPVLDDNGDPETTTEIVHHDAVYEDIEIKTPADFCEVVLEKPRAEDQIQELQSYVGLVNTALLDLNGWKDYKQNENKLALQTFLNESFITFTDGKSYGVSEDDQTEMSLNYMQYTISKAAGQEAVLEWHAKHEKCVPFTEEAFLTLTLMIKTFVYPYMNKMQAYKEEIYACNSIDEVKSIEIKYEGGK